MYADRLEDEGRTSIKDRLTGNVLGDSACRLSVTGKRQREDDKWKHDLYEDEQPQISRKLGGGDLRLKLRRKSSQQDTNTGGARDLREKLSGIILSQHVKKDPQKPKPEPETVKPTRKSVILEATAAEQNKVSDSASRRKTQQKADASVDGFLQSLGLEKYLITFQAEEVDMTALEHMTDDDLKAMGIPMVLESGDPHFHGTIAAIWNAITVLDQFFRIATEPKLRPKPHFESLYESISFPQF